MKVEEHEASAVNFCGEDCQEEADDKMYGRQYDDSMDGDHESALESVYGPMDEGQYDEPSSFFED